MRMKGIGGRSLLVLWATWAAACEPVAEVAPRVHVRVTDRANASLAGAEVRLDGEGQGVTDAEGGLWLRWSSARRGRLELSLRCPEGYREPEPRQLRARYEGVRRLVLHCTPKAHHAFVAIAAPGGEGLPVHVDGQRVGQLSEAGLLHAEVVRPAGSEVRVRIDTSSRPRLRPQNPLAKIRLDRDEILVMQQPFERMVPHRRKRNRRQAPDPRPRRLRSL